MNPLPIPGPVQLTGNQLGFLLMAAVAMLAAVGVVAMKNPVRSALFLVLNFLTLAVIYFSLGAQLLGITQIMVYAGAIMVLFLFVIMLLSLHHKSAMHEKFDYRMLVAVPIGLALLAGLVTQVFWPLHEFYNPRAQDSYGTPQAVGAALFTDYSLPFEITSILLLLGVVGAVLLAKRRA